MALLLRSLEGNLSNHSPLVEKTRVADIVVATLAELGVDTFYGIPGGAIGPVYDALLDHPQLRVINARHETGAAFMALGHSRAGQTLPCVLTTSGPGITNALTGLAAAHADGTPLVVIAGEVPRKNFGRGALQEGSRYQLDVLTMVRNITKFSGEVVNPNAAASLVRKAVTTARSGRQGPVLLSLPLDVAAELAAPSRASVQPTIHFELDEGLVRAAAAALQTTERGLILVGSGARDTVATRLVSTLAATLQLPVATTPKAKGLFPETDPLSLGIFGFGGHPSATKYLEGGIDTLLCVGCGLGETGTNSWSSLLRPSRRFVQIDIDAGQIGKNYPVDIGLVGPCSLVLKELLPHVRRRAVAAPAGGVQRLPFEVGAHGSLHPAAFLRGLQASAPADTLFTCDIGEHAIFALHYLEIDRADAFLVGTGLGSLGSGIGAAIGAKVACPDRPVVSVCGDFGFQMLGMELATCVQERIGVVFAVFNDGRMRMVEHGQSTIFGRSGRMDSPGVDFVEFARAFGARGTRVRSLEDLSSLSAGDFLADEPWVIDVRVDPNASFPMHGRITQLRHFAAPST